MVFRRSKYRAFPIPFRRRAGLHLWGPAGPGDHEEDHVEFCGRRCGDPTSTDWTAIAPFTYGRWDAVSQAHLARGASQQNADAAAVYYSAGAPAPEATRSALAGLQAPVLLVADEYDVALPPKCAAEYAGLFGQAELAVQPGGGHSPWLDDPEWFVQTMTAFLH